MKQLALLLLAASVACTPNTKEETIPVEVSEIATCGGTTPQTSQDLDLYEVKPIQLISAALGRLERPINTSSERAQLYFNQGVQMKYAFAIPEAISSFREAQKLDPNCAICYWGEAWALGSYLNGHMPESKAPLALTAIQKADSLSGIQANEKEKAMIEAMKVRYIDNYVFEERRVQDSIYALAMEQVYDQYPEDLDIATIYAEALFLLEPRGGTREMDDPKVMRIHEVLEGVLDQDIQHPGACHLYIHATESTPEPHLAESCAAYLGNAIPGASHINHMPSHTYNEIGQWGESVKANLQAWHTDRRAESGDAISIYPWHNLHMLLFAASFDGQGAVAMQAARDFEKETDNSMHLALTSVRFGRFEEILEMADRPDEVLPGSFWDFCQGYAKLKTGEPDFARVYLGRIRATADTTEAEYRWTEGKLLLGVLASILEGEIEWESGNLKSAITSFRKAVETEDDFPYSEPEAFPFSARHWLAAAYLESGQYVNAEKVYREELEDHPHNGWSLFGLIESLRAQAKDYTEEQADFEASWARSDTWIEGSKF